MNTSNKRWVDFIVNKPGWSILITLAILITAILGLRQIQADFTYRAFFTEDNPLRVEIEEFEDQFSNDDSVVMIVHSPSGIFDSDSAKLITALTEEMWKVPNVIRVDSISNYRWVHAVEDDIAVEPLIPDFGPYSEELLKERKQVALNDEIIPDFLLSRDGKTSMVVGYMRPSLEKAVDPEPVISHVRELVKTYQTGDHEIYITGRMAIMQAMKESAQADIGSRLPIVFSAIIIVLAIQFRHIGGVLPVIPFIVLSVLATMGLAGWTGIKISNITSMIPQFIIAICVADAVHIITSYFQLRKRNYDKKLAATVALQENVVPTLLTTVSTAIAFFSFISSKIGAIYELGILVGIGTIIGWFVSYFFLGAILSLFPNKKGQVQLKTTHDTHDVIANIPSSSFSAKYTDWICRSPKAIGLTFLIASSLSVYFASSNTINSNPFEYFAEGFWLKEANEFSEKHLSGSQGMEVVINSGSPEGIKSPDFLKKVESFQQWIDTTPGVVRTFSIVDIVKQSNRSLHNDEQAHYILPDTKEAVAELIFLYSMNLPQGLDLSNRMSLNNDAMRISVKWTNYDSALANEYADAIVEKGIEMGLDVHATGKMLLFQRMNGYVSESFFVTLLITIVLVSAVIMVVLRSFSLGWLSLCANVFPLCFGMAVLQFTGNSIDTGAVIVLSVCLGVAIDDTIHFVTHAKYLIGHGIDIKEVLKDTFHRVTPAITVTTIILSIAFGSFITADFVPNANFGRMASVILLTAWLANVTLLPAMMYLKYGKKDKRKYLAKEPLQITN